MPTRPDTFRPEHRKLLKRIGDGVIRDVEHFTRPYYIESREENERTRYIGTTEPPYPGSYVREQHGYQHIAVVVTVSGRCYVGTAQPHYRDEYNRRRGYTVAVGKALRLTLRAEESQKELYCVYPNFLDEQHREGRALRDWCREQLGLPARYARKQESLEQPSPHTGYTKEERAWLDARDAGRD